MKVNDVKVGYKFGKLEVIELLGYDKWRKNKRAKCKCECGKESNVHIRKLITGHTKTCGKCNRVEVGDVCGKWTIIDEVGKDKANNRLMLCRCQCGNEAIITATRLGTGRSKSCGKCYRVEIGDVYWELRVIAESGKDSANRRRVKCICSCGKETEVDAYNLRSGAVKSCGKCNETLFRTEGGNQLWYIA